MSYRVLVADDLSDQGVEILRRAGLDVDVKIGLKPEELEAVIAEYDALAVRSATKVTAKVIEKASRLKVVGRAGVGVDNVNLEAATRRGIVVMNTPGGSSVAVAELAVAMMLALSRHVAQATASIRSGKWEKKKFQGHELAGKTLGVVGIGNIGSVVVDRCQAMKMRVVAHDPFISSEAAGKLGVTLVSLDDLWAQADVVSLHIPLTEQTRNLLGAAVFAKMKKGALLVNCARGGLVDENALAETLRSGHLGGAALDVFEKEPPPPDHPLLQQNNLICTPHLGASTEEAQVAVAVALAEQMALFLTQGMVKNAINLPTVPKDALERIAPYLSLGEKLGSIAGQLVSSGLTELDVEFAGELASAPQRPITAQVLRGIMRHFLDLPLNEVNASAVARERGINVRETRTEEARDYVGLLTIEARGQGGNVVVAGTVFGKQEARVVRVNRFELEAVPEGDMILVENDDAPGVVGNIGTTLGGAGVNIARISLSRDTERKSAFSLINVDSAPGKDVLDKLRQLPHVRVVSQIRL